MPHLNRTLGPKFFVSFVVATATLSASACSGPDHITEPLVAEGGAYFASLGGAVNGATATTGGTQGSSGVNEQGGDRGGASTANFSWGDGSYDSNGGANVAYQGHFTGTACFAACHAHGMTFAGTVYAADGTSPASNAQLGIVIDGRLVSTYSGSQGNFYGSLSGTIDWAKAQIAVRTSGGTKVMATNVDANGNCNGCHGGGARIVVP